MRKKVFRAVLWIGTVLVFVGIPAFSAVADGPGPTPWIVSAGK